jgi:cytochrome c553
MEPYAKMGRELGVDDIARYFAEQKMEPTPVSVSGDAVARGRATSAQCVICHGPEGKGDPTRLIPSLAGQPPGYLLAQMLLFKQDRRNTRDPSLSAMKALMRTIADDTYGDRAAYSSSLP